MRTKWKYNRRTNMASPKYVPKPRYKKKTVTVKPKAKAPLRAPRVPQVKVPYKTNDKHWDEKIAKTHQILNTINHGMDTAAKPIVGLIRLAEQYAGKIGQFFSRK